jgi:hypothetical protein
MLKIQNASVSGFNRSARISRSKTVSTKLTEAEFVEVERTAAACGQWLSEWARDTLLAAVRGQRQGDGIALFSEVQALRLILINSLEPLLRGDKMSAEQFKEMVRYVKANKHKVAAELLASYREARGE